MTLLYIFLGKLYSVSPSSNVSFNPLRSQGRPQFDAVPHFRYISDIS